MICMLFGCLVNNVKHVDKMGPLRKNNKTSVYPSKIDDADQPKHSHQNVFCLCEEGLAHDN